jgi:DNA primase
VGGLPTPEGRARAAAGAVAIIGEHPNPLVRDQYLRDVADRCRVDPVQLKALVGKGGRPGPVASPRPERARREVDSPELQALRLALHQPAGVAALLDQIGAGSELEEVEGLLFADDLHLAAFRARASAATLHEALSSADAGAAELLRRLAVEDTQAEPEDVVALLVRSAAMRRLRELEFDARSSPDRALELASTLGWLKLAVEELDEPRTRIAASSRLVPWLLAQREEDA